MSDKKPTEYGGVAIPTLDLYIPKLQDILDALAHHTGTEPIKAGEGYYSQVMDLQKKGSLSSEAEKLCEAITDRAILYRIREQFNLDFGEKFTANTEQFGSFESVYRKSLTETVSIINNLRESQGKETRNYITAGGTLPNKASTAAKARSPEHMRFNLLVSVGDDPAGEMLVQGLRDAGVNVQVSKAMKLATTKASVHFIEDENGNPIDKATVKGPAIKTITFDEQNYINEMKGFLESNKIELVMMEGGMMADEKYGELIPQALMNFVKEENLRLIFSPTTDLDSQVDKPIRDFNREGFRRAETIFMNGNEFVATIFDRTKGNKANYEFKENDTLNRAISTYQEMLKDMFVGNKDTVKPFAITTLGKDGAYFVDENKKIHFSNKEFLVEQLIDKVGAGDATQAFAMILRNYFVQEAYSKGSLPLEINEDQAKRVVEAGFVGGSIVVQQIGPQPPKEKILEATEGILKTPNPGVTIAGLKSVDDQQRKM